MKTITVKIQVPDEAYRDAEEYAERITGGNVTVADALYAKTLVLACRIFGTQTTVNVDVNIEESA